VQRRASREALAGVAPQRPVFVDECGADAAMPRTHGRAPAGPRVYTDTPGHRESIALTRGLRLSGPMAAFAIPGAMDTDQFATDVEGVLVPESRPGDGVIWDDLQPHKAEEVVAAVEAAGARVVPLPPWSPDLTPIEEMVSKVKGSLRSAAARTKETVYAAFGTALHDVTLDDIAGWFRDRAAYAMQL
jgi:transposase